MTFITVVFSCFGCFPKSYKLISNYILFTDCLCSITLQTKGLETLHYPSQKRVQIKYLQLDKIYLHHSFFTLHHREVNGRCNYTLNNFFCFFLSLFFGRNIFFFPCPSLGYFLFLTQLLPDYCTDGTLRKARLNLVSKQ